jgi:hypothetical protein
MARSKELKKYILLGFVLVCVFLIANNWMAALLGETDADNPYYYRSTAPVDESFYLTRTAEYANYALGTPTPETGHGEHSGGGGGGGEESHFTPTPTIDWDAREDDQ